MKNQYFVKDKKAQIYFRAEGERNQYGVIEAGGVYPIAESSLWCYARQNSQTINFSSGNLYLNEESRFFVFNYNEYIVQGYYLLYNDVWYTIDRVDTKDDYNTDMYVYVKEIAKGSEPKASELKDYDASKL